MEQLLWRLRGKTLLPFQNRGEEKRLGKLPWPFFETKAFPRSSFLFKFRRHAIFLPREEGKVLCLAPLSFYRDASISRRGEKVPDKNKVGISGEDTKLVWWGRRKGKKRALSHTPLDHLRRWWAGPKEKKFPKSNFLWVDFPGPPPPSPTAATNASWVGVGLEVPREKKKNCCRKKNVAGMQPTGFSPLWSENIFNYKGDC